MKASIHPQYYSDAQVICACGNTFTTGSTKQQIKVEICSACHPFYTGAQKFVDVKGKIERFQTAVKVATAKQAVVATKKAKKQRDENAPKSLREMLQASR